MEVKNDPPARITIEPVDPNVAFGKELTKFSEAQKTLFLGALKNGASETEAFAAAMKLTTSPDTSMESGD